MTSKIAKKKKKKTIRQKGKAQYFRKGTFSWIKVENHLHLRTLLMHRHIAAVKPLYKFYITTSTILIFYHSSCFSKTEEKCRTQKKSPSEATGFAWKTICSAVSGYCSRRQRGESREPLPPRQLCEELWCNDLHQNVHEGATDEDEFSLRCGSRFEGK